MLRELNTNEMEMVSGGRQHQCTAGDDGCRETADDQTQTPGGTNILTLDNIIVTGTVSGGATAGAEAGSAFAAARFGASFGRVGGVAGSIAGGVIGLVVGAFLTNGNGSGNISNPSNFTPFPNGHPDFLRGDR